MEDVKEFYTIKEFAQKLRVCTNTIRKSIKLGHIQYTRTGPGEKASYRIPVTEAQRMCEKDMLKLIEQVAEKIVEQKMGAKQ